MSMDAATAALLRDSLRQALSFSADRTAASLLEELGWDEVMEEEESTAVRMLFEEHGAGLVRSAILDWVMLRAGEQATHGSTRILHQLPLGMMLEQAMTGEDVFIGLSLGAYLPDDRIAFLERVEGTCAVLTVEAGALPAGRPVRGLDPQLGWLVQEVPRSSTTVVAVGQSARLLWDPVRAAGHRALASEIVGVSRAVLDVAVEHARTRVQFGRPIGSFQAIRHRLAEAYAHTAGADAMVEASWIDRHGPSAEDAKAFAGQGHGHVTRHAMQVCGAIGLSWEHPLHRYVRRGFALDALLESHRSLAERRGAQLLADGDAFRVGHF